MTKQQTFVLFTSLGIFALTCVVFWWLKPDRPFVNSVAPTSSKVLDALEPDKVKAIEIKKSGVEIKLERKDKNWTMAGAKNRAANGERIDSLLSSLKDAIIVDPRSGDPKIFALDDAERTDVTLHREAGDLKLSVGKNNSLNASFIRKSGDEQVYEINKALDSDSGVRTENDKRVLDPTWFYDLKIFKISTDDIIDLAIKKGHNVVRIQRTIPGKGPIQPKQETAKDDPKPVWWITEPEGMEANDSTLNSICSNIANLNAKSYADTMPEKDRGLDKPGVKIRVLLKDGTEHTLTFGKIEGDDVVMSVSDKSDPYKVYKYVFDSVNKELADLKKKDEEKKDEKDASAPVPKFQFPPNVQLPPNHPSIEPRPAKPNPLVHQPPPAPPEPAPQVAPVPPPAVIKDTPEKEKK